MFLGKKTSLGFGLVVLSIATLCLQSASAVRTAPVYTEASKGREWVLTKILELEQDPEAIFHKFVREHNKKYEDETERAYRLGVFKSNLLKAKEFNQLGNEGVYGVTKFSDLSETEFATKVLMRRQPNAQVPRGPGDVPVTVDVSDIPDSWDWRDHGAVTGVKNQGTVGTCWAFSAVGNIEGQYALVDGDLISLSEEQVSDCDGGSFPQNNTGDCGVFGGWPFLAYEYVINAGGLELDSDYPYCMLTESCWPCPAPGYNASICGPAQPYCKKSDSCHFDPSKAAVQIASWASLSSDEETLKAQLYQNGPVSIAIDATALYVYWGGVIQGHLCSSDKGNMDHAVLLVGYGSEKNMWGKETPYWLVKNSWGKDWGEKGYFKLARGSNVCGVANYPTTSLMASSTKNLNLNGKVTS